MRKFIRGPGVWYTLSAIFFTAAIVGFVGCSSWVPAFRGDLDQVAQDQRDALEAAQDGDVWRTIISGGLALLGSGAFAVGRQRRYDAQPFSGKVAGREVTASEDEIVAVVEKARKDGQLG